MAGIPGVADFPKDFRKEDYGLRELRSAEIYGIVFATFSADAPEIDEWLGETRPHIARVLGGNGELKLAGYQKMMFHANWKTCNDNDGYHGALLHTGYSHMDWSRGDSLNLVTASGNRSRRSTWRERRPRPRCRTRRCCAFWDTGIRPQTTVIAFYPSAGILRDLDVIYLRYIIPRGPDETEVHFAYFALATDGDALVHHRARQSANLMGISGLLAIEDAVAYSRGHVGSRNARHEHLSEGPHRADARSLRDRRQGQRSGEPDPLGTLSPAHGLRAAIGIGISRMKLLMDIADGAASPGLLVGNDVLNFAKCGSALSEASKIRGSLVDVLEAGKPALDAVAAIEAKVLRDAALAKTLRSAGALKPLTEARLARPARRCGADPPAAAGIMRAIHARCRPIPSKSRNGRPPSSNAPRPSPARMIRSCCQRTIPTWSIGKARSAP
ncbi:MAG: hypothetical protein WDN03_08395 [Rhizomicrobium sp.]